MSFIVQVSYRPGYMSQTPSAIRSTVSYELSGEAEYESQETVRVLRIGGYSICEIGAAFDETSPDSLRIDPQSVILNGPGEQLEVRWFKQEVKSE